jgi:thiamine transport system substrate-binding protein
MKPIFEILVILLLLAGCAQENPLPQASKADADQILYLYAPQSFRTSGLEAAVVGDFEREYGCELRIHLFEDRIALAEAIKAAPDSTDLVLGIDNALVAAHQLQQYFTVQKVEDIPALNREIIANSSYRLLPYAYSYISLLYNSRLLEQAPTSFGQLQDTQYLRQIALLDPQASAQGAAFMHFVLALFGDEGYGHLLRALRKNVYRSYSEPRLAINALQTGECSMSFGLFSTPAWLSELAPANDTIKMQILSEGSYLYTESIGRFIHSPNPKLADAFLRYMLSESAQKMVLYKSGLLPGNIKVALPQSFSNLPLTVYALNDRVTPSDIADNHQQWLLSWRKVFELYQ